MMWQSFAEAGKTSDYRSPALARHTAGEAFSLLVQGLKKDHDRGVVTLGQPKSDPRIKRLTPAQTPSFAVVKDCGDGSGTQKYKSGDKIGKPDGRHRITAELRLFGNDWKVTRLIVEGLGSC